MNNTTPIRALAPITTPAPTAYGAGLAAGAAMTDDEALRYVNGMIAAINSPELRMYTNPQTARKGMWFFQELLAERGMVATIGYAGTAEIKPWVRECA